MEPVSEKNNFLYLTVGIILLLFVGALSDQFEVLVGHQLVQAFSVINIVVGIYGFRSEKMWFHSGTGVVLSVIVVVVIGVKLQQLQHYADDHYHDH